MPAWSFHIKLASEVSAVLNLDEARKKSFYIIKLNTRYQIWIFNSYG